MVETQETQQSELDLTHYLDILLRRRWIVASTWLIIAVTTAIITFNTTPIYQASALLNIEKERSSGNVIYQGGMVERTNEDYYQTQYKLLKSETILKKVYDDLKLQNETAFQNPRGLQKLEKAITISPVPRSRLVYIKTQSANPYTASEITNRLANAFIEQNISNQLFIAKEILQALQLKQDSPENRATLESLPAVVNSVLIQNLKQNLAKVELDYADISKRYTAKHPNLVSLRAQMASIKSQIQTETDKIVQSLKMDLSGQLMGNNIRLVDEAQVPVSPIKPNKKLNILLGILFGFILGFASAMLVEMIDQSIRTQDDVENKLHLPFLATIPFFAQKSSRKAYQTLLEEKQSLTSEAFRNMRTMIDFSGVGRKISTILVTSSIKEEGKSYIAANIAVSYAQLGERVLLLDGDLRRPKVHKMFGVSNARGVSEYLAKSEKIESLNSLIQESGVMNLHVMPCGTRPPNPSELLNTPKVAALLEWTSANYDRVIIDCPPIFPISDTLLWGKQGIPCVFSVRFGKTRVNVIDSASKRIKSAGMKILGVAINMASFKGLAYAPYGYYYHQYYQHYYQDDEHKDSKQTKTKV